MSAIFWKGGAWRGWDRHGAAGPGVARHVPAGKGMVWLGSAGHRKALGAPGSFNGQSFWHSEAGQGAAGRGMAPLGGAWQGNRGAGTP
jgi:hypothetical protein